MKGSGSMRWNGPAKAVGLILSAALLFPSGCKGRASDRAIGPPVVIPVPLGIPPILIPADNPPTAETIALGRKLFYDRKLSKNASISCSTCHTPQTGFSDGLQLSRGVGGMSGVRNAPTLINAAFLSSEFWDGRALSLEQQAASPIADPVEMNQPHEVLLSKLSEDPAYAPIFVKAFGSKDITLKRVENAIASFERTILSGDSPFDRYKYGGDKSALTPSQIRGLAIFQNPQRGNCAACHTIGQKSALFTDGKFHNIGAGVRDDGSFSDIGRFKETGVQADTAAFKTPTLRNVANTGPYMHDGSLKTLKEVVDFYAGGANSNPYLDQEIRKIHLTGPDRSDLVNFLKSLTGPLPANVGPPEESKLALSK